MAITQLATTLKELVGGSSAYQFGGESKLVSTADGAVKITDKVGNLGTIEGAAGTASSHFITKAQFDVLAAGAPALLDTFNELAEAMGDDPAFAASMTTLHNAIQQKITDLLVAIGIDANATHHGSAWTGTTFSNSATLATLLQEAETAIESKSNKLDPVFSGTVSASTVLASGASQKVGSATHNDFTVFLNNMETLQTTRSPSVDYQTNFTSWGTPDNGIFNYQGHIKVTKTLTLTGTLNGRDFDADAVALDNGKSRHITITDADADNNAQDFSVAIPSGVIIEKVTVRIAVGDTFDAGVIRVGINSDDDALISLTTEQIGSAQVYTVDVGSKTTEVSQLNFSLIGSPSSGSKAEITVYCSNVA